MRTLESKIEDEREGGEGGVREGGIGSVGHWEMGGRKHNDIIMMKCFCAGGHFLSLVM